MKHLSAFLNEVRLRDYKGSVTKREYNYHPNSGSELVELVQRLLKERGDEADLNDIDTSKVNDMSYMFYISSFNGDISQWDTSSVTDMRRMFDASKFNGDISQWDVLNVKDMRNMFRNSSFKGDIDDWDVNTDANMEGMFKGCPLEKHTPKWFKK